MEYTFYKLVCKDSKITEIYVGKTTDTRKRWNDHKSICNNENRREYNYKVYQFIRDNGNIDNWKMVEIEKKNLNKDKACLREGYWYEELKATLNTCKPGRTKKESDKAYYEANRDKWLEYRKEYSSQRVWCPPCKTYFAQGAKARHSKTIKHQNNLKKERK